MDGGVEEAFAAALDGLSVARILFDVRDQAGIKNQRAGKRLRSIQVSTFQVCE